MQTQNIFKQRLRILALLSVMAITERGPKMLPQSNVDNRGGRTATLPRE